MQRLCVYCGSRHGSQPEYSEAAKNLARALVKRGVEVVYGGASVGTMGLLADTVLAEGGRVIGIIPQSVIGKEIVHQGLSDLRVVKSMHERKMLMAELSDGFIALPGGLGTLDELFEILTWGQLGLHQKPCGLLNIRNYYEGLINFLDHAVSERFISAGHRAMLLVEEEPERLLARFECHRAAPAARLVDRSNV
jgi:uncharacterized protein (TIGR00730 family)